MAKLHPGVPMITLAASMFDLNGIGNNAAAIGATLFFAVGALLVSLVIYGLAKQRHL